MRGMKPSSLNKALYIKILVHAVGVGNLLLLSLLYSFFIFFLTLVHFWCCNANPGFTSLDSDDSNLTYGSMMPSWQGRRIIFGSSVSQHWLVAATFSLTRDPLILWIHGLSRAMAYLWMALVLSISGRQVFWSLRQNFSKDNSSEKEICLQTHVKDLTESLVCLNCLNSIFYDLCNTNWIMDTL